MSKTVFYGQHEDERILFTVIPHRMATYLQIGQLWLITFLFLLITIFVIDALPDIPSGVLGAVILLALVIAGLGSFFLWRSGASMVGYITDRRIIRFNQTFFNHTIRSLTWDEAV